MPPLGVGAEAGCAGDVEPGAGAVVAGGGVAGGAGTAGAGALVGAGGGLAGSCPPLPHALSISRPARVAQYKAVLRA